MILLLIGAQKDLWKGECLVVVLLLGKAESRLTEAKSQGQTYPGGGGGVG